MKWFLIVSAVALAGQAAVRADAEGDRADTSRGVVTLPSVGGRSEAVPGVVITLPAPPAPIAAPEAEPPKVTETAVPRIPPASDDHPPVLRRPAPIAAPEAGPPKVAEAVLPRIPPASDDHPPVLRRAARVYPAGFDSDSALFCQAMIGLWTEADAQALLGEPSRQRLAIGEDPSETGLIFAFADPTGHYQELELDFANTTGVLRGVFAYPRKMTWQECRRLWGAHVAARKANQGRTFYSYLNRRLDVLVDPAGKVISLGLY
jgi:hypothetical protein